MKSVTAVQERLVKPIALVSDASFMTDRYLAFGTIQSLMNYIQQLEDVNIKSHLKHNEIVTKRIRRPINHAEVLKLAKTLNGAEIARQMGVSKSGVHRIIANGA